MHMQLKLMLRKWHEQIQYSTKQQQTAPEQLQ